MTYYDIKPIKNITAFGLVALLSLAACERPGEELRPDVYDGSQVNNVQHGRVVTILSVSPARVSADNSANQRTSAIVGGILGAALGAGLASGVGRSGWGGGLAAGAGGAVGGGMLGSAMQGSKKLVPGVSIVYQDRAGTDALVSAQVGRVCEYKVGTAYVISTGSNVTRVQPNAVCPR